MPCIITKNPIPPASTTPAFLRTGRSSGVLSRDALAAEVIVSKSSTMSAPSAAFFDAASELSRATVRIVPSVGFITDLYADSTPKLKDLDISCASAVFFPFKPLENPLNKSDRITPELPLAPLSIAEAVALATALTVTSSLIIFNSGRAFFMVIDIFVPVSPSGTGNTLSSSTVFLLFTILFAPDIIASRSILPLILKAALLLI